VSNLLRRWLLGNEFAELVKGYKPPEGGHNSIPSGTPTSWSWVSPIPSDDVPNLDTSKITTGRFGMARMPDGTSGYVLTAQGADVDPAYAAAPAAGGLAIFGDGSDGDVTTTGDVTLTRDMFYNSLTVDTGHTLYPAGYRIFVKGTLTVNTGGIIDRSGNDGSGTTGGAALAAGTLGGSGAGGDTGAGGDGGAGGSGGGVMVIVAKNIVNNGTIRANGGAGVDGSATSGTHVAGNNGGSTNPSLGGAGGDGGDTGGSPNYLGGTGGTVTAAKTGKDAVIGIISESVQSLIKGGGGGGSGGCDDNTGGTTGTCGGGGGGGGYILIIYNSASWNVEQALGGTGGAANGGQSAGSNGAAGTVVKIANA